MSPAEKQPFALRDLAVIIAKAKSVIVAPDLYSFHDLRIRIEYANGKPQAIDVWRGGLDLKVLSVVWQDHGDAVVVLHRTGSWEDSLRKLVRGLTGVISVNLAGVRFPL
jgi:hypothetical protein